MEDRQYKEEMIKAKWSIIFVIIFFAFGILGYLITEII